MAYFPPASWYTFPEYLPQLYEDFSDHSSDNWNAYATEHAFTDMQVAPPAWDDLFVNTLPMPIEGVNFMENEFTFDASAGIAPSDVYPLEEETAVETQVQDGIEDEGAVEGEDEVDDESEGGSGYNDTAEPALPPPGSPESTLSEIADVELQRRQPRIRSRFTPYDSPARRFSCPFCPMKMTRGSDMARHLLTHKKKRFCCSELECPCGREKKFSRRDAQKRHVLTVITNEVEGLLAAGGQDTNRITELRNRHQTIAETTSRKKRA
ncbi:unnamed protein product [Cyclocybe aegerita]|uniref:C2H2-type domain-containing protein n=1 Tax=Cyclocybe aegerita TaxID=1973307 RepID=A0A8S0XP90_CYCAE|nr:unnamed protein product [Cyclocybe aegerita]